MKKEKPKSIQYTSIYRAARKIHKEHQKNSVLKIAMCYSFAPSQGEKRADALQVWARVREAGVLWGGRIGNPTGCAEVSSAEIAVNGRSRKRNPAGVLGVADTMG